MLGINPSTLRLFAAIGVYNWTQILQNTRIQNSEVYWKSSPGQNIFIQAMNCYCLLQNYDSFFYLRLSVPENFDKSFPPSVN